MINRQTAYFVRVGELLKAKQLEQEEGQARMMYISERKLRVSRVNLMGFIINKVPGGGFEELMLDDGTGSIILRNFDTELNLGSIKVGDCVKVIGKLRYYNNKYIIPEIINPVEKKWMKLRTLELKTTPSPEEVVQETEKPKIQPALDESSPKQRIYEMIKEEDAGEGVGIPALCQKSGLVNVDQILNNLIEDGEIFKVSPSRVKVL